ncbi:hypothetical protein VINE108274_05065 [Vibrio neptunius]
MVSSFALLLNVNVQPLATSQLQYEFEIHHPAHLLVRPLQTEHQQALGVIYDSSLPEPSTRLLNFRVAFPKSKLALFALAWLFLLNPHLAALPVLYHPSLAFQRQMVSSLVVAAEAGFAGLGEKPQEYPSSVLDGPP